MMVKRVFLVLAFLSLSILSAVADVSVAKIFGSNMVLQRNAEVPVWGFAEKGEVVTVEFNGQKISAKANKEGKWMVKLLPMKAGGPFNMAVKGKSSITLENILIGDVWICSGQSNMEYRINQFPYAEAEAEAAKNSNLRLFTVQNSINVNPQDDIAGGEWKEAVGDNILPFSAVGYFFGKNLINDINVPVGLVSSEWGGTGVESWTSRDGIRKLEDYNNLLDMMEKPGNDNDWADEIIKQNYTKWEESFYRLGVGFEEKWFNAGVSTEDWEDFEMPNKVKEIGLKNYTGSIWFKRSFKLNNMLEGKDLTLILGAVRDMDLVWVNGHEVTATSRWWRMYSIPKEYLVEGENEITIRLFKIRENAGFLSKPENIVLHGAGFGEAPSGHVIMLNGQWKYKTGESVAPENIEPEPEKGLGPNSLPNLLYNAMISPITDLAIKGAIWYQGEHNAGCAEQYQTNFANMITDWRTQFGQGDFPFILVQLANYMAECDQPCESDWAELREAQYIATKLPNVGVATAIDIGDGGNIHPKNKQDVGKRLYLSALKIAYSKDLVYIGPTYKSMEVVGDTIFVSFDNTGSGLKLRPYSEALTGFSIAGEDKNFVWATASIEGNRVKVFAPEVSKPVAVRYAWENNPIKANLYNKENLPAMPFRTDNWDGITKGNKITYGIE